MKEVHSFFILFEEQELQRLIVINNVFQIKLQVQLTTEISLGNEHKKYNVYIQQLLGLALYRES